MNCGQVRLEAQKAAIVLSETRLQAVMLRG
jgi:hypothetical protein